MNLAHRLELWGDRHHPKWLDIIRILLGVFLCYKGFEFLNNMGVLLDMMNNRLSFNAFSVIVISHVTVFVHILGGFLIALGLLTRFACLIQIPILIGAVFFVNSSGNLLQPFSELWLSIVVLLLLVCFLIVGNGAWSFEWFVEHDKPHKRRRRNQF
ncbi:MAG: DoxX family protein [Chitinophagaceae bacterium]|nr:DoxX family protein [Chitinophagaceae bacterium]